MKKLFAIVAAGLFLAACTDNPSPAPTPSFPSPPPAISEGPTDPAASALPDEPATTSPTTPPAEGTNTAPSVVPSSEGAAPPATQFAARWGVKYPNVPEYAILKAANATCKAIEAAGTNWNDSAATMTVIEAALTAAGLNGADALEFAQDAEQNYCSSVSNPT